LLAPLLALGLTLAPTGAPVRLELAADGAFTYTAITPSGPAAASVTGEFGLAGSGRLRVAVYPLRPLVDDDAPLGLQPFLQRAFRLLATGSFFGSDTEVDAISIAPTHQRAQTGTFVIGAEGYPDRRFYAAASLQVQSIASRITGMFGPQPISSTTAASVTASLGVRVGDALVAGSWTVLASQTDAASFVTHMPTPGLSAQVVLRRRWSLSAALTVLEGGAQASGGADLFFGRRLDVSASVNGGHAAPSGGLTSDFAGGRIGAFFWQSRFFGVGLSYAPQWTRYTTGANGISQVAHLWQLTVATRPR